jgi:hypothetical protein
MLFVSLERSFFLLLRYGFISSLLILRSYLSAVLLSEGDLRNSSGIAQNASCVKANCSLVQKYA